MRSMRHTNVSPVDVTMRVTDGSVIRVASSPDGTRLTATTSEGMTTVILSEANIDVLCATLRAADQESGR